MKKNIAGLRQRSLKIIVSTITATALVALIGGPTFAGEGQGHKKCEAKTQKCLDKMAAKMRSKGWLGIESKKNADGRYEITVVSADSPASRAGLQPGDVLIALNGVKLKAENKAELKKIKKSLTVGAVANYVVKRDGSKQQVAVTLGQMPEIQIAEWVGRHMVENHTTERVAAVH